MDISRRIKKLSLILAVAAVLAAISFLAWLNHRDFERAMLKQARKQLYIIAKSEAQSIEEYMSDIHQEIEILSSEGIVRLAVRGRDVDSAVFQEVLSGAYEDTKPLVEALYLMDEGGRIIAFAPPMIKPSEDSLLSCADVKEMLSGKRPFTTGVFKQASGDRVVAALCPVFDGPDFAGFLRAVISVDRIEELVAHINTEKDINIAIFDENGTVINYVGESMITRPVSASVPIKVGSENWSVKVTMDYAAIVDPINKNARDNLVFVCFVLIVLGAAGAVLYRIEKRNAELSISKTVTDLINKQLHLEIDKRREIEKKLKDCMRGKR